LGEEGILPDFIICRSKYSLDSVRAKKFEEFANVSSDRVISAPDVETVYQIPLDLEKEQFGIKILKQLHLTPKQNANWIEWEKLVNVIRNPRKKVTIAIVGKYLDIGNFSLTDSYLSIYQALIHAAAQQDYGVTIKWVDAKKYEQDAAALSELDDVQGIIVPGGFGASGVEGKMKAIEYSRIHNIPYLGLCYGMHLAAVEFARNVCGMSDAHTTEVIPETSHPIIDILPMQKHLLENKYFGGTMRLGEYEAKLKSGSKVAQLYKGATLIRGDDEIVSERHRHRYEMNPKFVPALQEKGLVFSGYHDRADGTQLMEYLELPNHPFFVATQAHPEFKSRLGHPNPLFYGFVKACVSDNPKE
jgi:CTP synthase